MSPSKSSNEKAFYMAFVLVVAALCIAILAFGLLVSNSGPRVRHVVEHSINPNGLPTVNQALTIVFDRPITTSSDLQSAIEIQPKVEYTLSQRNQHLTITFDQNLLSGTHYILTLKPGLE